MRSAQHKRINSGGNMKTSMLCLLIMIGMAHLAAQTQPPAPPVLLGPDRGAETSPWPMFIWTPTGDASVYRLQIMRDSQIVFDDSTITTTAYEIGFLDEQTTYSWRVSAKNAGAWGSFSDPSSFTTRTRPSIPDHPDEREIAYYAAIDSFDVYLKTGSTTALAFVEAEYANYLSGIRVTTSTPHKKMKLRFNGRPGFYEVDDLLSDSLTAIYTLYRDSIKIATEQGIREAGGLVDDVQVPQDAGIVFYQETDSSGYLRMTAQGVEAKFHKGGDIVGCNFRLLCDVVVAAKWKLVVDSAAYRLRVYSVTAYPANSHMDGKPRFSLWIWGYAWCFFAASVVDYWQPLWPNIETRAENITETIFAYDSYSGGMTQELFTEVKNSFPLRIVLSSPSPNNLTIELRFMEGLTPNSREFVGLNPPTVTDPKPLNHIGFGNPYGQFQAYNPSDPVAGQITLIDKMGQLGTHSIRFHVPWRDVVGNLVYNENLNPDNVTEAEINALASDNARWQGVDAVVNHALDNKMDVILQLVQGHTFRHDAIIPRIQGTGYPIAPSDSNRGPNATDGVYYVNGNFYLYHLKLFAHAAVKRYASNIAIWTIEGELNAARLNYLASVWRYGDLWADESPDGFQQKVWNILRDAVRQRDPSAKLSTVFHILDIVEGLQRFGRDVDIIGVNCYPNLGFATPVMGFVVGEMVWATRRALEGLQSISPQYRWKDKEVFVTETNYPAKYESDPPSDITLSDDRRYYSYKRQKEFMQEAIETAAECGAKGFFWWMFMSRDKDGDPIDPNTDWGGIVRPDFQFKQPAATEFNDERATRHPGKADVILTNKNVSGANLQGAISMLAERDGLASGATVYAVKERTHTSKTEQQFFQGLKHLRWENLADQYHLNQPFDLLSTDVTRNRYALFTSTSPVTITTDVADIVSTGFQIRDPWYVEPAGSGSAAEQINQFHTIKEKTYEVFLEQGAPIRNPSPPTIL